MTSLLDSLAAKFTVAEGSVPPKSAAFAATAPAPVTANFTLAEFEIFPVRVIRKVNGVVPLCPSAFWLLTAAIEIAEVPLPLEIA